MKKATVELRGIGRVYVNTDRTTIRLARAVTAAGVPVNWRFARVSRNKRYYREADLNNAVYLRKLDDETFLIVRAELPPEWRSRLDERE